MFLLFNNLYENHFQSFKKNIIILEVSRLNVNTNIWPYRLIPYRCIQLRDNPDDSCTPKVAGRTRAGSSSRERTQYSSDLATLACTSMFQAFCNNPIFRKIKMTTDRRIILEELSRLNTLIIDQKIDSYSSY